ncbi:MAG: hypothetical protein AMJ69_09930 [Gammaproteobacteria bacterium SG8_47]|nr:MAG: hypothetical protein AMJ69_09930 [Gammaproteobacteria bacterium SG8_47]
MTNTIHPTAVVSGKAQLGVGNEIGPFAVIEDDVVIGDNNLICSHAVIKSGTRMGSGNSVHDHAAIGGVPQDLKFKPQPTTLEIGDGNMLREYCSHVGHDCQLGDNIVVASSTALAGHVHIEDRAFVSGGVMIHQFTQVGCYAMIGGNSKITQDVLPFFITDGVPGVVRGLNLVGLKRAGFDSEDVKALKAAFRALFREQLSLAQALERLRASDNRHVGHLVEFISRSKRSFHRG